METKAPIAGAAPDDGAPMEDSNLVAHAQYEMNLVGLFDDNSDYGGMIGKATLELVKVFANQGHSGASAQLVGTLFYQMIQYQILAPLTDDPQEWMEVTDTMYPPEKIALGSRIWQSRRLYSVFSTDGGITWKNEANNTEGKSIKKEDQLNAITETETDEDNDSEREESRGDSGSRQDLTTANEGQPFTEPKEASGASSSQESGVVERRQRTVAKPEQPNTNQPGKSQTKGRAGSQTPSTESRKKGKA